MLVNLHIQKSDETREEIYTPFPPKKIEYRWVLKFGAQGLVIADGWFYDTAQDPDVFKTLMKNFLRIKN